MIIIILSNKKCLKNLNKNCKTTISHVIIHSKSTCVFKYILLLYTHPYMHTLIWTQCVHMTYFDPFHYHVTLGKIRRVSENKRIFNRNTIL